MCFYARAPNIIRFGPERLTREAPTASAGTLLAQDLVINRLLGHHMHATNARFFVQEDCVHVIETISLILELMLPGVSL